MVSQPLIQQQLAAFERYGLQDLDKASLMNRVDTKFLVEPEILPQLLDQLQPLCAVLDIDGRLHSAYSSTYFDDEKLSFYHQHHNKHLNRHKVRFRTYTEQQLSYLEVKFRNNKSRTIKNRQPITAKTLANQQLDREFLNQHGICTKRRLLPTQHCQYSRISLARESTGERLTMDVNLRFENYNTGCRIDVPNIMIVELKQARLNRNSALYQLLRSIGLKPRAFSKYCIGLALDKQQQIKTNLFKRTLIHLTKDAGVPPNE